MLNQPITFMPTENETALREETINLWFYNFPHTSHTTSGTEKYASFAQCLKHMNLCDYWSRQTDEEQCVHSFFVLNQQMPDPCFFDVISKYVSPPALEHKNSNSKEQEKQKTLPFLLGEGAALEHEKGQWIQYMWRIETKCKSMIIYYFGCSSFCMLCVPIVCIVWVCLMSLHAVQYMHVILAFLSIFCLYIAILLIYHLCSRLIFQSGLFFKIENNIFVAVNMRHIFYARQYVSLPLQVDKAKNTKLLSLYKFRMRHSMHTVNLGVFYLPEKKDLHILNTREVLQAFYRSAFLLCPLQDKKQQCQILVCLNPFDFDVGNLISFLGEEGHQTWTVKWKHPHKLQDKISIVFALSGNFKSAHVIDQSDMLVSQPPCRHEEQFLICLKIKVGAPASSIKEEDSHFIHQVVVHDHGQSEPNYCDV